MISLILPIRGEEPSAAAKFRPFARDFEIVVADGGCSPQTVAAFSEVASVRVSLPDATRGRRLAAAARAAGGDVLLFLHADSRPPPRARLLIEEAVVSGVAAGAFRIAYENPTPGLRVISFFANLRSRWLRMPFGDQGIFCTRQAYESSGGFRDLSVCDDVDFVLRLRRVARLCILEDWCVTSPRRYLDGAAARVVRNWLVLAGYSLGVSPRRLERWYRGR